MSHCILSLLHPCIRGAWVLINGIWSGLQWREDDKAETWRARCYIPTFATMLSLQPWWRKPRSCKRKAFLFGNCVVRVGHSKASRTFWRSATFQWKFTKSLIFVDVFFWVIFLGNSQNATGIQLHKRYKGLTPHPVILFSLAIFAPKRWVDKCKCLGQFDCCSIAHCIII